ncbi:MAG: BspA family leucine-rich repeat surface protein [Prevotella sp.]|nr:BspA family leucine-rich repeat surface protein [Prevotella sp.]
MNSRKHEEILCVARYEKRISSLVDMSCLRMVLAAFAVMLSLHAHAAMGYVVLSSDGKTMTFKYGNPTGTKNVDYYETDNTSVSSWQYALWSKFNDLSEARKVTKVVFESSFASTRPKSTAHWFKNLQNLTTITGLQYLNTSQATDMSYMFYSCEKLTSIDVSKFNTSNVTDMRDMFFNCSSLRSLNLSNFNTSNVTNMGAMFGRCFSLTSLNVSSFNTSKVTYMRDMFNGCRSLPSLNVSKFNTSNVTDMGWMFYDCRTLTSLDLRNFDMRQVTLAKLMIGGNSNLQKVVFGRYFDVGKLNVNNSMYGYPIISNCPSLRYVDFYLSDDTDAITSANVDKIIDSNFPVPVTTVVYLPHGSQAIKDRTNFVYSYNGNQSDLRCPKYYSVDKVDIEFPRQFKTNEAVYDRTATMGSKKYGSVILPFAFTSNSDIQAFKLTKIKNDNKQMTGLTFSNTNTVAQHTPFVFQRKNKAQFVMKSTSFGITVYPVRSTNKSEKTWTVAGGAPEATAGSTYDVQMSTSTGASLQSKGYYVKETVNNYKGMYFVQNNEFKRAIGPLNLVDHRVLFWTAQSSVLANTLTLSFEEDSFDEDDIATAIEAAETEQTLSEATEIYDASGCRLSEARKGLNIIRMSDGTVKKVVIK